MNYTLSDLTKEKQKNTGLFSSIKKLYPLLEPEKKAFGLSLIAVLINSALTLIAPLLIAHTIDVYIVPKHFHGVIVFAAIILLMYIGASIANYIQTIIMGTLGQRTLFRLRNEIFNKLQELPVSFLLALALVLLRSSLPCFLYSSHDLSRPGSKKATRQTYKPLEGSVQKFKRVWRILKSLLHSIVEIISASDSIA
jgi:ABC-type multidrug transport system fused ATPase/permease subunit